MWHHFILKHRIFSVPTQILVPVASRCTLRKFVVNEGLHGLWNQLDHPPRVLRVGLDAR